MNDIYRLSGRKAFRTVEEWKSALMTLPEKSFFELLRSVFGNIKTPFNKQRLLDNLFVFLSKDEIRKTIAAYINEQDHKIITAVTILNEPALGKLGNFFAGELNYAELHALVINLEERLILYRFRSEGILRLALNPVLEPVLAPLIADTRLLFPSFPKESTNGKESSTPKDSSVPKESSAPAACIGEGRILAAVFAFILGEVELFKGEGGPDSRETPFYGTQFPPAALREIRKKVLDEGKRIFPALDLELTVRTLLALGFVRPEGRGLVPCKGKIQEFARLLPIERYVYWTAALYQYLNETERNPDAARQEDAGYLMDMAHPGLSSRNRMREIVSTIHHFAASLDPERKYPEVTLRRFAELQCEDEGGAGIIRLSSGYIRLPFESFMAAMEATGFLERTGNYRQMGPGVSVHTADGTAPYPAPVIAMDTAFSFILYPEISFADALGIGAFCSVKLPAASGKNLRDGTVLYFELTRDSLIWGFDQYIGAEEMAALLDRLSLNRIDPSLGWTLREWEGRYAGVSLHQGVILALSEERRYLAEAEPLASLISRTLAPGVYLLVSGERSEAVKALRRAGVDIIAQPPVEQGRAVFGTRSYSRDSFPHLETPGIAAYNESYGARSPVGNSEAKEAAGDAAPEAGDVQDNGAASIQEKFRRTLEKKQLTKAERDELAARIERRMVLCETQLDGSFLRFEKLEARGLDYPGKMLIAKQAVEAGSLIEVRWPGAGGETQRVLGIAQTLEKQEGDSILIIKNSDSSSVLMRIPLGKISLLRRIKQSIFGE